MNLERLDFLLTLHTKLMGHPKMKVARALVETELASFNDAEPSTDRPAPVYPRKSGIDETGTDSVPTYADRRA